MIIEAFRMGIDPRPDWFKNEIEQGNIVVKYNHPVKINNGTSPNDTTGTTSVIGEKEYCEIKTLEGIMTGSYGDYIIRGVRGEIYPCKPEVFEETYEKVEE